MQSVASEMNLSETAFVSPGPEGLSLRWFTPAVEVDLCGHATLASAHILWETGLHPPEDTLTFQTKSGLLRARHQEEGVVIDLPATETEEIETPEELSELLGLQPVLTAMGGSDYLCELESERQVREVRPDLAKLLELPVQGCIVTSANVDGDDYDFASRYFAPAVGLDEDPVTGAAHCALGPFWRRRLDKEVLVGHQVSKRFGRVGGSARSALPP